MAVLNPPSFLQGVATETAAEARLMLAGLVSASGIVGTGDLLVAQHSTPNMSVDVAAGGCWIKGTESSSQGIYHCYNDATVTLVIAAADATNPRRDLVIAKVQDAFYSGGTNAWSLAVVTGTPAGSPADPAVPANSLILARVSVAALAASITNAMITDLRVSNSVLKAPLGMLGYSTAIGDQVGITTEADLANLQVTVTVGSFRRIRISGQILASSTVTGDKMRLSIKEGATSFCFIDVICTTSSLSQLLTGFVVVLSPTAGAHTYKLTMQRNSGTGVITVQQAPPYPGQILVEDMGSLT